jgi:hypothetical protein
MVSLYVDDLFVTGNNPRMIDQFKAEMIKVFEMKGLGEMSYFLSMEVQENQRVIFIGQQKYAKRDSKKIQNRRMQINEHAYELERKVL